jgi:acyl-CoA synthetase (AMP-forming)/AMP-acid ligase II
MGPFRDSPMKPFAGCNALPVPSVVHRLAEHARNRPDAPVFSQVDRQLATVARVTFGELWHISTAGARRLQCLAERGDRVVIFFDPGIEPLFAFWSSLVAGLIPVPASLPPSLDPKASPDSAYRAEALGNLLQDCQPRVIIARAAKLQELKQLVDGVELAPRLIAEESFRALAECTSRSASEVGLPLPESDEIAFLQYTSGSTAYPKGVVLTHANLVHNQIGIERTLGLETGDSWVSWLPLFHDMGLIGDAMQVVWKGGHSIKILPGDFLRRPTIWMEAVDRFRCTITGGPNFSLQLAAQNAVRHGQTLDLSCLRNLYCGSEPVRTATLSAFAAAYAPHGFHRELLLPCYGMAEHALIISGHMRERPYRVNFHSTAQGKIPEDGGAEVVSCGRVPWDEVRVEICDPETQAPLPDGTLGEVVVYSRSASPGYWSSLGRRPDRHEDRERMLRTGDLGFLLDGEIFIHGRLKNTVILRGRKWVAEDVEHVIEQRFRELRRVRAVLVQVRAEPEDELVVVIEGILPQGTDRLALEERVREVCDEIMGTRPQHVVFVRPSTVPRTTSGKLQRHQTARYWRLWAERAPGAVCGEEVDA